MKGPCGYRAGLSFAQQQGGVSNGSALDFVFQTRRLKNTAATCQVVKCVSYDTEERLPKDGGGDDVADDTSDVATAG
jgi:hypothetical protein